MSISASPLPETAITIGYGILQTEPSITSTSRVSFSTTTTLNTCPFSVEASWGEMGLTEVRICRHDALKKCGIFR